MAEDPSATGVAERWAALAELESFRDHWWWRQGWSVGRRFYTWHLTFERFPEVHELAHVYQQALALPGLDPVPTQWLHLTMQGVGFVEDVHDDELTSLRAAARRHLSRLAPLRLTIGPADADPEGVMLQVTPWAPVRALRGALRAADAEVRGTERVPESADEFMPHVTVAYSNREHPAEPVRRRLHDMRENQSVEVRISSAQLIEIHRDNTMYEWRTVDDVALDGEE